MVRRARKGEGGKMKTRAKGRRRADYTRQEGKEGEPIRASRSVILNPPKKTAS
jgi:hypothetical protein